jgi:membrane-bound ClpP family serine protease
MWKTIRSIIISGIILAGALALETQTQAFRVPVFSLSGGLNLLPVDVSAGSVALNWIGILLILGGIGLFIAEFFTPGIGLLFGAGLVSLVVGIILIVQGGLITFQVDPWVVGIVIVVVGGAAAFTVNRIVHTYHRQPITGEEDAKGKKALVKRPLNPEGTVLFEGELWSAELEGGGRAEPGEEVIINSMEGLKLWVKKK